MISINFHKCQKLDVFSNGINIEIFSVVERKFIYARVNERGVGETDACGSGALALFTYLREINKVDDDAVVYILVETRTIL